MNSGAYIVCNTCKEIEKFDKYYNNWPSFGFMVENEDQIPIDLKETIFYKNHKEHGLLILSDLDNSVYFEYVDGKLYSRRITECKNVKIEFKLE